MKIRSDFVTNSSSSSFVLDITVYNSNGKGYTFTDAPAEESADGCGIASFDGDLEDLTNMDSVTDLCKYLVNHVHDDYGGEPEDEDVDDDWYSQENEDARNEERLRSMGEAFIDQVTHDLENLSDVKSVSVSLSYTTNGEFSRMIPEEDDELCELAERVCESEGEEKEEAKAEMLEYINRPHSISTTYGDYDHFSYEWDLGDDEYLEQLAQLLCDGDLGTNYSGEEFSSIDMKTGKITQYVRFNLNQLLGIV